MPIDRLAVFLVLLVVTAVIVARGHWRGVFSEAALPLAATLGLASTLLPTTWGLGILAFSGVLAWRGLASKTSSDQPETPVMLRTSVALLLLTAGALSYRLGSFAPDGLVWEGTTIDGIADELGSGRSIASLAIFKTLWGHGTISAGNESPLLGLPALISFTYFSTSVVFLRLISLTMFIVSCAIFSRFVGRLFGGVAGLAALAILCLTEPSILYARYASSMAATLLAVTLAFVLCHRLVSSPRYLLAISAAASIFLATLGYSPARIPAVVLAISTPIAILSSPRVPFRRRCATAALFTGVIAAVVCYQASYGRLGFFFSGRGEQFFGMTQTGWFPPQLANLRSLSGGSLEQLTPGERVGVAIELIRQVTASELYSILSPFTSPPPPPDGPIRIQTDPPYWKVLPGALAPFALIGMIVVLRRKEGWLTVTVVGWLLATCCALLCTNRIDTHRSYLMILPLSLLAAAGFNVTYQAARRRISPTLIGSTAAIAVVLLAILPRIPFLYASELAQVPRGDELVMLSTRIPGPLMVATQWPVPLSVRLALIDQQRRSGEVRRWMPNPMAIRLGRGFVSTHQEDLQVVEDFLVADGVLLIAPPKNFLKLASFLTKKGAEARRIHLGGQDFVALSLERSPAFQALGPVTVVPDPPAFPQISLTGSRLIPLSSVKPLRLDAPVKSPSLNRDRNGNPLRIGDSQYNSGLGLSIPTTIDFVVPHGVQGLHALIGVEPGSADCGASAASLAIFDERGTALYESPLLQTGEAAREISIPIHNAVRVTVQVTDGTTGIACSEVVLADAAWVLNP